MKFAVLLVGMLFAQHCFALSYDCFGISGEKIIIRNLKTLRGSHTLSENGYIEYKGNKAVGVGMSSFMSSSDENNMQKFSGIRFDSIDRKKVSNIAVSLKFYGDAKGIAEENIRSDAKVFFRGKLDPELISIKSCIEVADTQEFRNAQKAAQNNENANASRLVALKEALPTKSMLANEKTCEGANMNRSQSAVENLLGKPGKILQPTTRNSSDGVTWVYGDGVKIKFDMMDAIVNVDMPEVLKNDCLYFDFKTEFGERVSSCLKAIRTESLSYEAAIKCHLDACKTNDKIWTENRCLAAMNILRPNLKSLPGIAK